jgi:hypothetical protein
MGFNSFTVCGHTYKITTFSQCVCVPAHVSRLSVSQSLRVSVFIHELMFFFCGLCQSLVRLIPRLILKEIILVQVSP